MSHEHSNSVDAHSGMRPFGDLVPFRKALEAALQLCDAVDDVEAVPLPDAPGRVAARDVTATEPIPNCDRSAMDGFAFRATDLQERGDGAGVPCVGRIAAGEAAERAVEPGTCVEVATGAPLPAGADTVVPVEDTERRDDRIHPLVESSPGRHVIRAGSDIAVGEPLVHVGDVLSPAKIGALTAGGVEEVDVWRSPRVLLVPTGDEVVPLGRPLEPGQVHDSNSTALEALLRENGATANRAEIHPDEPEALERTLSAPQYDLVVTLAGSSVGRRDRVPRAVERLGEIELHGVAVKPGKPLLLGHVDGAGVVGLPGFPTSCLLLAYVFVEPLVRRIGRRPAAARRRVSARLDETVGSPRGKHHLVPVRLDAGRAVPVFKGSSAISSMSRAEGWFEVDGQTEEVPAGTRLEVILF